MTRHDLAPDPEETLMTTPPTEARLPILDLSDVDFHVLTMASEEQQWKAVDALLSDHDYQRSDVPPAWAARPLRAWCWLVLVINRIDFDPDVHHPLATYGIDVAFSTKEVRLFTWFLA
jgi:hypothetical protein